VLSVQQEGAASDTGAAAGEKHFAHYTSAALSAYAPEAYAPEEEEEPERCPKKAPKEPKKAPKEPKKAPKEPKKAPKEPKRSPKGAQRSPKGAPKAPKEPKRRRKGAQKEPQKEPPREPSIQGEGEEGGVPGQMDGNDDEEYGELEEVTPVDEDDAGVIGHLAKIAQQQSEQHGLVDRKRKRDDDQRPKAVKKPSIRMTSTFLVNDGSSLGDSDLDDVPEVSRLRGVPVAFGDPRLITHPAQVDRREPVTGELRLFMVGRDFRFGPKAKWVPGYLESNNLYDPENKITKVEGIQCNGGGGFAEVRLAGAQGADDKFSVLPFRSCEVRAPQKANPTHAYLGDPDSLAWVSCSSSDGSSDDGYLSSLSAGEQLMAKVAARPQKVTVQIRRGGPNLGT